MSIYNELLKTKKLVNTGKLYAPQSFKYPSIKELAEVCNGCGAAGSWFRPPSKMYGTQVVYAFHIHDWMYSKGKTIEDKEKADRVMLNNLYRLIELDSHKWYKPTWLQRRRALKYYWGVKYGGGPAYWEGK
jgi:hypothetical protein